MLARLGADLKSVARRADQEVGTTFPGFPSRQRPATPASVSGPLRVEDCVTRIVGSDCSGAGTTKRRTTTGHTRHARPGFGWGGRRLSRRMRCRLCERHDGPLAYCAVRWQACAEARAVVRRTTGRACQFSVKFRPGEAKRWRPSILLAGVPVGERRSAAMLSPGQSLPVHRDTLQAMCGELLESRALLARLGTDVRTVAQRSREQAG